MKYYCYSDNDCKYPTMTAEQILTAIQQAIENGAITDPDEAIISKLVEINASNTVQVWVGTEAQFNALSGVSRVSKCVIRIGTDGVLYLCTDDTTLEDIGSGSGSGSGGSIEAATAETIGGIKAKAKTSETLECAIGSNDRLYAPVPGAADISLGIYANIIQTTDDITSDTDVKTAIQLLRYYARPENAVITGYEDLSGTTVKDISAADNVTLAISKLAARIKQLEEKF